MQFRLKSRRIGYVQELDRNDNSVSLIPRESRERGKNEYTKRVIRKELFSWQEKFPLVLCLYNF